MKRLIIICLLVLMCGCYAKPGNPINESSENLSTSMQDYFSKEGQTAKGINFELKADNFYLVDWYYYYEILIAPTTDAGYKMKGIEVRFENEECNKAVRDQLKQMDSLKKLDNFDYHSSGDIPAMFIQFVVDNGSYTLKPEDFSVVKVTLNSTLGKETISIPLKMVKLPEEIIQTRNSLKNLRLQKIFFGVGEYGKGALLYE